MCGIAGALSLDGTPVRHDAIRAITDALLHRGPDEGAVRLMGDGVGVGRAVIGFGHRRLKVIDLTSAAAQPMRDPLDRGCLVYNGELYNAAELRRELESRGVRFRSRSDTEVVLMALLTWGADAALRRFNGMFALAFWDAGARRLTLARDRFGEKPLYYAVTPQHLIFASELEALLAHGGIPFDIDPDAIELFLTFGYIPAPWSVYRAVRKLPHAASLTIAPGGAPEVKRYYRLEEALHRAPPADPEEAVRAALEAAVRRRLDSDVPLGAFLSGGIDSSAIVTYMTGALAHPPRTYSVGIDGDAWFDEAPMARRLAGEMRTGHVEARVDAQRLRDEIPEALAAFGEPFGDSSAIPCSLIAREARRHLTVALSGDGGDEVFGGYRLYRALAASRILGRLGSPARTTLRRLLDPFPARYGGGLSGMVHRGRKLLDAVSSDLAGTHAALMSILPPSERRALRPGAPELGLGREIVEERYRRFGGGIDRVMAVEIDLPLPDDMLTKVDRTSMRHALEVRAPFLDPELVELSMTLPASAHFSIGSGKRLLRRALRGRVPDRILDAPKRGFEVPVGDWITGPLAALYRDTVTPTTLQAVAGLDARIAGEWFEAHRSRRADRGKALWALFSLCHWQTVTRPRAERPTPQDGTVYILLPLGTAGGTRVS